MIVRTLSVQDERPVFAFVKCDGDGVVAKAGVQRGDGGETLDIIAGAGVGAVDRDFVVAEAGPDGYAADVVAGVSAAQIVDEVVLVGAEGDCAVGQTNDVDLAVGVREGVVWIVAGAEFAVAIWHVAILAKSGVGVVRDENVGLGRGRGFVTDHERLASRTAADVQ